MRLQARNIAPVSNRQKSVFKTNGRFGPECVIIGSIAQCPLRAPISDISRETASSCDFNRWTQHKPRTAQPVFSYSRVFLGRSLSCLATALSLAWLWTDRSVPFGKYCRSSLLVFSFDPRCHGLCGSQKYTSTLVASLKRLWSANSLPRSHVRDLYSSRGSLCDCFMRAEITLFVSLPATFASMT